MSVARGYGLNGQALYCNIAKPTSTWIQFTVSPADTAGRGVTSVKSNGYLNYLFMHTSQTPGIVNGITNPNPADGYVLISLATNFNTFLGYRWGVTPPAGSTVTTTSANVTYSISALGTATLAQWQAKGLPQGLTPTIGQAFTATASGTIGGSASVAAVGVPTIVTCSPVGVPLTTIANANVAQNGGAQIILQFAAATNSSTTTLAPMAPVAGSVAYLELMYNGSTVGIGTGAL